jgi:predicted MFS family arabinose efflux permease
MPYICLSIFVGGYIDSHKKKSILLVSDLIPAIVTFTVIIAFLYDAFNISMIYAVNIINGTTMAFQSPAQSATAGLLVPNDKYAKASGMQSFSNNLITVATPMIASSVLALFGLNTVILIDIISFLFAFFVLLFLIDIPEHPAVIAKSKKGTIHSLLGENREGFSWLKNHQSILKLMINMAVMNFFSRLAYENILSPMILARTGENETTLGIVSTVLGVGGILGGIIVSAASLPKNNLKVIYVSAGLSFLLGDLLMGIGQSTIVWVIAGLGASIPIPFIGAGYSNILYHSTPKELQGRVFSARNSIQYSTIPVGILLGGLLADQVFEPFMNSDNIISNMLGCIVGKGQGSGMAVMFLCTGVLGALMCFLWYRNLKSRFEIER